MFDRIVDVIVNAWDWLIPGQIVDQYESGIHLRRGKFLRILKPGMRWRWWGIDAFHVMNVAITTMPLRAQSLTTSDKKAVVVSSIIKYQVTNVKPLMLKLWDATDVLRDTSMGAVKSVVSDSTMAQLIKPSTEQKVLDIIQGEVREYGIKVHRITFVDLGTIRSYRLISSPDEYADE